MFVSRDISALILPLIARASFKLLPLYFHLEFALAGVKYCRAGILLEEGGQLEGTKCLWKVVTAEIQGASKVYPNNIRPIRAFLASVSPFECS